MNIARYYVVKVLDPDGLGGHRDSYRIRDRQISDNSRDMLLEEVFSTEEKAEEAAKKLNAKAVGSK